MTDTETLLTIDGAVQRPQALGRSALAALDPAFQVADVGRLIPNRRGGAVRLEGILQQAQPVPTADYLTLHASSDDFHASIPLAAVRDRGLVVYQLDGGPLPPSQGGPIRFLIPDFAACRTREVDECANVKFVDRMELTVGKGHDNRPSDDVEHAALHEKPDD